MGFKVDTSFLRFLTMGALGVRQVAAELRNFGFEPIELERYCTSNKIWATKVKRLRLPDLLCVRTGLRVEVRAKSDLKIRMSEAPKNPDRAWDAGLRDTDLIALIACIDSKGATPTLASTGVYFSVRDLRQSVGTSTLGPPKSASEGAERDRTWPSVVPKRPGTVQSVTSTRLTVLMDGDGKPARRQGYALRGKAAYAGVGTHFEAKTTILAGSPAKVTDPRSYLNSKFDPLAMIRSADSLDRYSGAKATRFRPDVQGPAVTLLRQALLAEEDGRVKLEIAATAAQLQMAEGWACIRETLFAADVSLSMESILILTELKLPDARTLLVEAARRFVKDERRQAAIWGLGRFGHTSYDDLLPYIADEDENVALHAIQAFGPDASEQTITKLMNILLGGDRRAAPAAATALRVIASDAVIDSLSKAASGSKEVNWALAALGSLPVELVRAKLSDPKMLARLEPLLLLAPGNTWITAEERISDRAFLARQSL